MSDVPVTKPSPPQQRERVPRPVIVAMLAALMASPLALQRVTGARTSSNIPAVHIPAAHSAYGLRLTDVAAEAGVRFVHQAPRLDPKLDHIMPQVASMGASAAVTDFDADGWDDFYLCNSGEGSANALYRNQRDGTFKDVAAEVGLADLNRPGTGVSMGSIWADFDNDGFEDVFVYKWGRPELLRNNGGKSFTPVGEKAGLPVWVNANSAVWLDYDLDGHIDLFIAGYYDEKLDLWKLANTRMMPESFEYANNGGRKYLLRNRGDGTFEDVTERMGIKSRRWTLAVAAADLRGTGYPDLFLANDYGVPEYFVNDAGKGFRECGETCDIADRPKSGMNVSFGDVLNQGWLAIYKTNISEPGYLIQGNDLWIPRTPGSAQTPYDNAAGAMGVEMGGWSWGSQFGDFNNDGRLDLYLTNGYVSAAKDKSYWYDFSKVAGGGSVIISDAANWPAMRDMSLSGYQQKRLWLNDGTGKFVEVAQVVGATDVRDGRAVALADFWNRGALDILTANQRAPATLYKNDVKPDATWVQFALRATTSNRSAIGAQVRVFWDGRQQVQEVHGGSGFCAQNTRRLHFGLGKAAAADKVEVRWPSGKRTVLENVKAGQLHVVTEPS